MAWSVTAASGLPTSDNDTWDGGAAAASIFEWAGGEEFDPAKAKRAFCFQDDADPKLRGNYKDPFARVIDGRLTAVKGGVDAAVRRIPDTNGPSDAQKSRAIGIMEAYQKKFGEGENATELWAAPEGRVFAADARALSTEPTDELRRLASERALDPSVFDDSPPYFWRALISNQRLDTYGTKMHDSSLKNYAADGKDGVAFQNSHKIFELPFGASLDARYFDGRSPGGKRVEATFYTIPDLDVNGVNTNQLIRGMRSGIVRDVSIGFYGGTMRCSVCDRNIWDYECEHLLMWFRGESADDGEPIFAWVVDAHMAETSACCAGATPGAAILKAQREAKLGRIKPEAARYLESLFRVNLPAGPARGYAGFSAGLVPQEPRWQEQGENLTMAEQREGPQLIEAAAGVIVPTVPEEQVRAALVEFGVDPTLAPLAGIRWMGDELKRLRPLADDGRQYRADLIDDALTQGVRAHGDGFAQDTYKALLESSSIAVIKRMRDDWKASGDGFFAGNGVSAGGRTTGDRVGGSPQRDRYELPDAAYKS